MTTRLKDVSSNSQLSAPRQRTTVTPRVCLFVGDMSLAGGTERACATLAQTLANSGWQITILSMHGGHTSFFKLPLGTALYHVWPKMVPMRWRFPLTIWRIKQFLRTQHFDAWVDAETALTAYSTAALAGSAIRHIAWENFHLKIHLRSRLRWLGRQCAVRWADQVVLLTQADRLDWCERFGNLAKFVVIPHTVQEHDIAPTPFPERKRVVLSVGRLCRQKGFDLLLQSWALVATKHPQWVLQIVGSGEDELELRALTQQLNVVNSVEWVPSTPHVVAHYARASIYALSSRFEGFGLVLIEAMAQGLPIVAFDCRYGPAEIIKQDKTGRLVQVGDVRAFANELDQLMSNDALRKTMAQASYDAFAPYKPGANASQWLSVLRDS
jgi:glycosyltransferase involved in cell wall biosynthesis